MQYFQTEPNLFCVDKPVEWTPLQALEELRRIENIPTSTPLTYAGRLDPMAEGLLLVLAGPRVHEKDAFLKLDKQYHVTAILGIATDSYDLLGLPTINREQPCPEHLVPETLHSFTGPTTLPLPAFSSPPVDGKPLFWWKRNKPDEITQPIRTTHIHAITDIQIGHISAKDIAARIHQTIPGVQGDFRQTDIVHHWDTLLKDQQLTTISFTVDCESGTYIRSLVHELGARLGTGACVFTLRRTIVGSYTL